MKEPSENRSVQQEAAALIAELARLKTRALVIIWVDGLGWTITAFLFLCLLLMSALGWWGGAALRVGGWSIVVVGTVIIGLFRLILPLHRLTRKDAVARRIGHVYPDIASSMLSASQLAQNPQTDVFDPLLLCSLFRDARHRIVTLIPRHSVFPFRRLLAPTAALAIVGGGAITGYSVKPHVMDTGYRSLFVERRPPEKQDKRVLAKAPVLGDLSLVLRYPEYLKRESRKLDSISGGLVAPVGTTVIMKGRSLVPDATSGEIHLPDGGRTTLSFDNTGKVRGSFVVNQAGPFSIALGSTDLMLAGPDRNIELEPDASPVIRLLRPTENLELAMDGEVVLELEAEDDHGLSHLDLVLRAGEHLELRKTIVRLASDVKRVKTKYRWTPESVRITDETELQLELEAYDNDTILGPKPGRSDPLTVRFLTPQSRHKNAMAHQNQALDTLVDLLAHRLETPVPVSKNPEQARERFGTLRGETEDLLARTAKLIVTLNNDPLSSKQLVETFSQVREDISNQLVYEARLYDGRTLGDYRSRIGVDKVTIRILENAVIRIDDLIIEQQLSKVVQTGSNLESERSALSKLLARFGSTRSEAIRRAVLEAISEMEAEVQRLQKSMETIRGKVGDTYLNPSSLIHMDLLGTLSKLRKLLAGDDLKKAMDLVTRMETDLGRLLAGLEGGLLSFRTDRFGEGERFLGDLLERVIALESGQLQLRRETIALKRRYQERLAAVMRGKINGLVKKQIRRVERIRRLEDRIKKSAEDKGSIENGSRVRTLVQELDLALGQGDLNEARETADDLADIANDWSITAPGRFKRDIVSIVEEAENINAEINEAYPRPGQLLTERDIREARSSATQQRLLTSKTRKLKDWIKKQGEEARFLSSRALDSLNKVARRMARGVSSLENKQINQALDEQSSALDELARLREDLKRGEEVAPFESRPVVVNGRVSLPDPEEFKVPPEFRDDILEAMRGELPNQYEEAIKKYYETLVQ